MKGIIQCLGLFLFTVLVSSVQSYGQKAAVLEQIYPQFDSLYQAEAYKSCIQMAPDVLASLVSRKDTLAAWTYFLLGDSYYLSGDKNRAVPYYEKEIELRRGLAQTRTLGYSNGLYNLIYLYGERGEYAKAKKMGDELLQCDAELKGLSSAEYVASLLFVLDILEKSGDYLKAKEVGEKGLSDINGKHAQYAILLSKVADVYTTLGLYSRAESAFMTAIDLLTRNEGENSANVTNSIINLSSLYRNQGRYPEAEELLNIAIATLKVSSDENASKNLATALNNLALVQLALSQNTEAETSLNEVLKFDRENYGITHPNYASSLANMGFVQFAMNRMPASESLFKESMGILKANDGSQFAYASSLNNLANIYRLGGDAAKAVPLYEEARATFAKKAGEFSAEYATTTFNLGQTFYKINDPRAKT